MYLDARRDIKALRRHTIASVLLAAIFALSGCGSSSDDGGSGPAGPGGSGGDLAAPAFHGTWELESERVGTTCVGEDQLLADESGPDGPFAVVHTETEVVLHDGEGGSFPGTIDERTVVFERVDGGDTVARLTLTLEEDVDSAFGTVWTRHVSADSTCVITYDLDAFRTSNDVDLEAPSVVSRTPAPNATGVAVGAAVSVVFDEAMDTSRFDEGTYRIEGPDGRVNATLTSMSATSFTLTPDVDLPFSTSFTVVLSGDVRDASGNRLGEDLTWSFTTASAPAPSVVSTIPADGATNGVWNQKIEVVFDSAIDPSSVTTGSVRVTYGASQDINGAVSVEGNKIVCQMSYLQSDTYYSITISPNVRDTDGNALGASYNFGFTTLPALRVTRTSPSNEATGVRIESPLVLTFDRAPDPATINTSTLKVIPDTWVENRYRQALEGTWTVSGNQATFRPAGGLWQEYETGYRLDLSGTVKTVQGHRLEVEPDLFFETIFWDPDYYYFVHCYRSGLDRRLDTFANSYNAFMENVSPGVVTTGTRWYFVPRNGRHLMKNQYGGDTRALDPGDGSGPANLLTMPNGNHFAGMLWDVTWANPRDSREVQRRGESPGVYWLWNQWGGEEDVLGTEWNAGEERYMARMQSKSRNISRMWWFERASRR